MSDYQKTAAEAIREVRKNLPGNWGKGAFQTPEGYCIAGHLNLANGQEYYSALFDTQPGFDEIHSVIKEQFPDRVLPNVYDDSGNIIFATYPPEFNDHPDTTEADVLMVLEKAEILAQEKA